MKIKHKVIISDARDMSRIKDSSIDLVVTSPPYPMIKMWDELFFSLNPKIKNVIKKTPNLAFELMNKELDKVWLNLWHKVKPGGFVCINIGDATRNLCESFQLYPNSSRITKYMIKIGFLNLPKIIWNKPVNSTTKFMGSGMLPKGAYVTLEHEDILIFKKPGKNINLLENRRNSALFFYERNQYYSSIWKILGTKQNISKIFKSNRKRSGAFPCEIPKRLIQMYSSFGDIVLDPFLGTGTTSKVAMMLGRSSIGIEIDPSFKEIIMHKLNSIDLKQANKDIKMRFENQKKWIFKNTKTLKHFNNYINNYVVSSQSKNIKIHEIKNINILNNEILVNIEFQKEKINNEKQK